MCNAREDKFNLQLNTAFRVIECRKKLKTILNRLYHLISRALKVKVKH